MEIGATCEKSHHESSVIVSRQSTFGRKIENMKSKRRKYAIRFLPCDYFGQT